MNDDFDFRTPEERQADDDDERQVVELARLDTDLDDQYERLERLAHEDPVGVVAFGDSDAWIDKRLHPDTRK